MSGFRQIAATFILFAIAAFFPGDSAKAQSHPLITADNADQLELLQQLSLEVYDIERGPKPGQMIFRSPTRLNVINDRDLKIVNVLADLDPQRSGATNHSGELLTWTFDQKQVTVNDLGQNVTMTLQTGTEHAGIVVSPDGKMIATGGYGKEARLWTRQGKLLHVLDCLEDGALTPVFSPDGKKLVIGNRNGLTQIFDVSTGKRLRTLPWESTQELAFHPDGKSLAVGYVDGDIGLWDVATGKILAQVASGGKEVYTVDWSPNGELLATAGVGEKITLWKAKTLEKVAELDGVAWVIQVRFTADGTRLMTSGGTARMANESKPWFAVWAVPESNR